MSVQLMHASAVALAGRGLLICGASGTGKSALALELIALGASLIADDQVALQRKGDAIEMRKPETLPGLIEARGVGLLHAPMEPHATLWAMVDLDHPQTVRSPEPTQQELLGVPVNVIKHVAAQHFPAAVFLYLKHGREDSL